MNRGGERVRMGREADVANFIWGPVPNSPEKTKRSQNNCCPNQDTKYSPPEWMLIRPKLNNMLQLICNIAWEVSGGGGDVSNVNLIDSWNKIRPSHACYVHHPHHPFYLTTLSYLEADTIHVAPSNSTFLFLPPSWVRTFTTRTCLSKNQCVFSRDERKNHQVVGFHSRLLNQAGRVQTRGHPLITPHTEQSVMHIKCT